MVDAARRGATVLPEVSRMSIAHDPLLEGTRHSKSGEEVRSDRKGREKTKGKQRDTSSTRPPGLLLPCPVLPNQREVTVMLEKGEVLVWLRHFVEGRASFCKRKALCKWKGTTHISYDVQSCVL